MQVYRQDGPPQQTAGPNGRVDSATEMEDVGSIPGRVKLKTIKRGIHSFPALRSALRDFYRSHVF